MIHSRDLTDREKAILVIEFIIEALLEQGMDLEEILEEIEDGFHTTH